MARAHTNRGGRPRKYDGRRTLNVQMSARRLERLRALSRLRGQSMSDLVNYALSLLEDQMHQQIVDGRL